MQGTTRHRAAARSNAFEHFITARLGQRAGNPREFSIG
jgi:hypothetical protein